MRKYGFHFDTVFTCVVDLEGVLKEKKVEVEAKNSQGAAQQAVIDTCRTFRRGDLCHLQEQGALFHVVVSNGSCPVQEIDVASGGTHLVQVETGCCGLQTSLY